MSTAIKIKEIFHSQYPSLCRLANRYVPDQAACEDIVQDCFVKYWEFTEKGKVIETPYSYLKTSVTNSCFSYLKKKSYIENIDELKHADHDFIATNDDEKEPIDEIELIKIALEKLPTKCRKIFELSKIQKKSYKEIAENLEISVKTVENQMGKALKIMRDFVKDNPQYFPIMIIFFQHLFLN